MFLNLVKAALCKLIVTEYENCQTLGDILQPLPLPRKANDIEYFRLNCSISTRLIHNQAASFVAGKGAIFENPL